MNYTHHIIRMFYVVESTVTDGCSIALSAYVYEWISRCYCLKHIDPIDILLAQVASGEVRTKSRYGKWREYRLNRIR